MAAIMVGGALAADAAATAASAMAKVMAAAMGSSAHVEAAFEDSEGNVETSKDNHAKGDLHGGTSRKTPALIQPWLAGPHLTGQDAAMVISLDKVYDAIVNVFQMV